MKNTCPFYIVFHVLKVFLIKICKIQPLHLYLLFLVAFILAFTSADINFYKFLELHSTLSEKKDFCHEFSFLTDHSNPAIARAFYL